MLALAHGDLGQDALDEVVNVRLAHGQGEQRLGVLGELGGAVPAQLHEPCRLLGLQLERPRVRDSHRVGRASQRGLELVQAGHPDHVDATDEAATAVVLRLQDQVPVDSVLAADEDVVGEAHREAHDCAIALLEGGLEYPAMVGQGIREGEGLAVHEGRIPATHGAEGAAGVSPTDDEAPLSLAGLAVELVQCRDDLYVVIQACHLDRLCGGLGLLGREAHPAVDHGAFRH